MQDSRDGIVQTRAPMKHRKSKIIGVIKSFRVIAL
jgi:hypothetical protein